MIEFTDFSPYDKDSNPWKKLKKNVSIILVIFGTIPQFDSEYTHRVERM